MQYNYVLNITAVLIFLTSTYVEGLRPLSKHRRKFEAAERKDGARRSFSDLRTWPPTTIIRQRRTTRSNQEILSLYDEFPARRADIDSENVESYPLPDQLDTDSTITDQNDDIKTESLLDSGTRNPKNESENGLVDTTTPSETQDVTKTPENEPTGKVISDSQEVSKNNPSDALPVEAPRVLQPDSQNEKSASAAIPFESPSSLQGASQHEPIDSVTTSEPQDTTFPENEPIDAVKSIEPQSELQTDLQNEQYSTDNPTSDPSESLPRVTDIPEEVSSIVVAQELQAAPQTELKSIGLLEEQQNIPEVSEDTQQGLESMQFLAAQPEQKEQELRNEPTILPLLDINMVPAMPNVPDEAVFEDKNDVDTTFKDADHSQDNQVNENEEIKNIVKKYFDKIPDIEPQYVLNEGLAKSITHYFNDKVVAFPLFNIDMKIDRNLVKIPWQPGAPVEPGKDYPYQIMHPAAE